METLKAWCGAQFAERKVEPNSGLGKAISYLLNHWEKLTLFLREPGAPLDNNLVTAARGSGDVMPTAGLCRVGLAGPRGVKSSSPSISESSAYSVRSTRNRASVSR
jgi:hypothetical protein